MTDRITGIRYLTGSNRDISVYSKTGTKGKWQEEAYQLYTGTMITMYGTTTLRATPSLSMAIYSSQRNAAEHRIRLSFLLSSSTGHAAEEINR